MDHPGGPVILFVAIGNTQEEADQAATRIVVSMAKENPLVAERIADAEKWDILWTTREVIGSYLMQSTGNQWISAEVASNLKGLEECMNLFGHIGALTMHPGVVIPRDWDDTRKMQAVDEKFAREAELNLKYQTCGGEWGQFAKRTAFFEQRYGQDGLNIIRKMKQVFDPNNIINRGIIK